MSERSAGGDPSPVYLVTFAGGESIRVQARDLAAAEARVRELFGAEVGAFTLALDAAAGEEEQGAGGRP